MSGARICLSFLLQSRKELLTSPADVRVAILWYERSARSLVEMHVYHVHGRDFSPVSNRQGQLLESGSETLVPLLCWIEQVYRSIGLLLLNNTFDRHRISEIGHASECLTKRQEQTNLCSGRLQLPQMFR